MSTLPRTRSLSSADTSSLKRNFRLERNRPASLCEGSWNKIDPSLSQDRLRRIPSQANNLCTTVPTSIVNRTLGGRHTPTRNSLRHSRMAVLARNAKAGPPRRWNRTNGSFGRVAFWVICSYLLVGVMGVLLALWLLQWAPALAFKELPHYAGGMIIVGGVYALLLIYGLPRYKKSVVYFLKILLLLVLLGSLLSCASVCTFNTLHLISLAPMECRIRSDIIIYPASSLDAAGISVPPQVRLGETLTEGISLFEDEEGSGFVEEGKFNDDEDVKAESVWNTNYALRGAREEGNSKDSAINNVEMGKNGIETEEENNSTERGINEDSKIAVIKDNSDITIENNTELIEIEETSPLSSFEAKISENIYINVSICVCYKRKNGWRIVMEYPKLSCHEVKNILPIFLVASCVVTIVGAVLSVVLVYLLWVSRKRSYGPYGSARPSEVKPFIYKSSFRNSQTKNNSSNGSHLYR